MELQLFSADSLIDALQFTKIEQSNGKRIFVGLNEMMYVGGCRRLYSVYGPRLQSPISVCGSGKMDLLQ